LEILVVLGALRGHDANDPTPDRSHREGTVMGGRRRLRGGYGVWLKSHRSPEGVLYRRYLRAGEEAVGGIKDTVSDLLTDLE
jgi:hypothetical protein